MFTEIKSHEIWWHLVLIILNFLENVDPVLTKAFDFEYLHLYRALLWFTLLFVKRVTAPASFDSSSFYWKGSNMALSFLLVLAATVILIRPETPVTKVEN